MGQPYHVCCHSPGHCAQRLSPQSFPHDCEHRQGKACDLANPETPTQWPAGSSHSGKACRANKWVYSAVFWCWCFGTWSLTDPEETASPVCDSRMQSSRCRLHIHPKDLTYWALTLGCYPLDPLITQSQVPRQQTTRDSHSTAEAVGIVILVNPKTAYPSSPSLSCRNRRDSGFSLFLLPPSASRPTPAVSLCGCAGTACLLLGTLSRKLSFQWL